VYMRGPESVIHPGRVLPSGRARHGEHESPECRGG
jgi:hypothetical protein